MSPNEKLIHMKKHYTISYWFDAEDQELHLSIYQGDTLVYTEDILGEWEDREDIQLTCLEIAGSRGYVPALFESQSKSEGRAGGIISAKLLTPEQRRERARNGAKKRWGK